MEGKNIIKEYGFENKDDVLEVTKSEFVNSDGRRGWYLRWTFGKNYLFEMEQVGNEKIHYTEYEDGEKSDEEDMDEKEMEQTLNWWENRPDLLDEVFLSDEQESTLERLKEQGLIENYEDTREEDWEWEHSDNITFGIGYIKITMKPENQEKVEQELEKVDIQEAQ